MAAIVYPDAALIPLMNRLLNGDLHYHLFNNNFSPNKASVLGDFTESALAGYAPITVAAGDFGIQAVVLTHGFSQAPAITFTTTDVAGESVYGYYVTDTADALLLWFVKFDAVRAFTLAIPVSVVPFLGDFSANPP